MDIFKEAPIWHFVSSLWAATEMEAGKKRGAISPLSGAREEARSASLL